MNVQKSEKGFTIIEVVLVLAIAGLIFLMVFIALPALQRSQRDQARRNDASTVAAAVQTFKGNNNGSLGAAFTTGRLQQYIDKLDQYEVTGVSVVTTGATVNPNIDQVLVRPSAKCPTTLPAPGNTLTPRTGAANGVTNRNAIAVVRLENNGNASQWQLYCVEV